MFKDYDKYLNASLKVYIFVLLIVFIMKLVGLDYFGLTTAGKILSQIDVLLPNDILCIGYTYLLLYFTTYVMISVSCKDKSKKMKMFILATYPLSIAVNYIPTITDSTITFWIISLLYLLLLCLVYNKFKNIKEITKRYAIFTFLNLAYQIISVITRDASISNNSFLIMFILNLDYILLLLITYTLCFKEGGANICCQQEEAGLFSLKKINLKNLPKKLQENWRNFKKQDKVTKLTFIIYFILSLIWNIFTIITVLFAAMLNDTLIECIFILTSFWLSKREFGKAFHLSSMIQCFIVSNLTYYVLNRVTTPLCISILIPIMLGVGLSYVTSKLVKETYKPLYKGMPKEVFENTILKVVDKDSHKYKICYDFYINGKSDLSISLKYNYSVAGIRKIKNRVNDKIKRL